MMKRTFDLVFAMVGLLSFLPLLLLVALVIRARMGAPVFFRQERPGAHGVPFTLLKFRTMTNALDDLCDLGSDANRLTSFGHFLRRSSIDELPELLNVIWGDMSLVGPRPLLMQYLQRYTPVQARRHDVKPGMTGWAQVNGRNAISWEEKFKLDVWYVDHQSFWLDMKIILLTVKKVLFREGISAAGTVTMPEFNPQIIADLRPIRDFGSSASPPDLCE